MLESLLVQGRDDSPAAAIDARVEYKCPFADFPLEVSHGDPVSFRRLQQQSGQLENLPILLVLLCL